SARREVRVALLQSPAAAGAVGLVDPAVEDERHRDDAVVRTDGEFAERRVGLLVQENERALAQVLVRVDHRTRLHPGLAARGRGLVDSNDGQFHDVYLQWIGLGTAALG